MIEIPKHKKVIIFDGICNLCNSTVEKIIKLDVKHHFMFVSNQSEVGQNLIRYLNIDPALTDSVILYEPGVSYDIKSTAAIKVMSSFGGFWTITKVFWLFPESFRDAIYDYIASNRYQWFGQKDTCMRPSSDLKERFLE
ncbi:thiol-disulfide oxidoreductase DCC family protein [uncultured Polaribacter sp.]|uniref:thiol-disulfide oxidoreductase DCC family protein n=1 Tax=uncultured Polaribacter sp. TaxID=174711 RepID=UPI002628A09E|nr:DCC1-like thiol-disulfide oxidoreductase family protein [uncultured Polaribacter sp.]